jgi:hypothetical protein
MIRPILSYALTAIVLLSQTGLPVHLHYCKGMLESVSVFFNAGCVDHEVLASLSSCCQKPATTTCDKDKNCCDDEVKVLLQDFDSLLPHFDKWDNSVESYSQTDLASIAIPERHSSEFATRESCDTGPPIYILFHSLKLDV